MKSVEVSKATTGRIPGYLRYLKRIACKNISATTIAKELGLGEVQVRKDLGAVSGAGRPRTGYNVQELICSLEQFLGADKSSNVVIIGAGKLGRALLDYQGFGDYGLNILAAFDIAVKEKQTSKTGKNIYPAENFQSFCKENDVRIGVIAVPAENAQQVCDDMLKCGIKAIWCFAPCTLIVPEHVPVQYENMALSLAYLNKRI